MPRSRRRQPLKVPPPDGARARVGLWQSLHGDGRPVDRARATSFHEALDPGALRPRLAADVEVSHFDTRWGTRYTMIKNPRGPLYFRLSAEDGRLVDVMDGTRSVRDMVTAELGETGALDVASVAELVDLLQRNGFLDRPFVDAYALIRSRTTDRETRFGRLVRRLFKTQTVHFPGAERLTDLGYRLGGRLLFTWPAQVLLVAVVLLGPVAFALDITSRGFRFEGYGLAGGILLLFALDMAATMAHETGHALAIRHAGRGVLSAGFQLYLGHPAFFIDSADILMAPRRERIRNAWYGPYMSLVVSGVAAVVVYAWPDLGASGVLFQLAALTYLTGLLNLIPFLELDGYWMLTDALDMPDLRPRSLAFLRHELPGRLVRRGRLTRQEWGLVAFGVVGVVFTVVSLWTSWLILRPVFTRFIVAMWDGGILTRILLVVLAVVVFGPLVRGVGKVLRSLLGSVRFAASRLQFLTERPWRVEAGQLIDRLPLLARIPIEDLNLLAGRVELRRFTAGRAVVRQGQAADAFYVVRSGRLAVVEATPEGGERVVSRLARGDAFGELSLLEARPRTATVRAEEVSECFVIRKGLFERYLAPNMRTPEISTVVEAWSLPPFRQLREAEAVAVSAAGTWVNAGPGETVIEQGAAPDAYYVLGSGQAEVLVDGKRVSILRAGDHFGELALLRDSPRTATVRTLTPCRLFRLDRDGFDRFVATSFRRGTPHPPYDAQASRD